jgi:hypothetical protein
MTTHLGGKVVGHIDHPFGHHQLPSVEFARLKLPAFHLLAITIAPAVIGFLFAADRRTQR